ncbi:MAG: hypothetical protein GX301_08790 [Gracilibacteraceae bacterium]|nr:hypothetical protein [Gracilibacteraceae bacterium]
MSDNGDYIRVMKPNRIVKMEDNPYDRFTFIDTYYLKPGGATIRERILNAVFALDSPMSYPSLQHFFIKLAIIINILRNKIAGVDIFAFHIGAMGILYIVMYSASLALLMECLKGKSLMQDIIIKAAAAVIFCDIGYIAYFNSFYGEAPQLILFILSAALGIRLIGSKYPTMNFVLLCLALTAFAWTKFANIPVAVLVLTFTAIPLLILKKSTIYRLRIIALLSVSFFILANIWSIVPEWMNTHTNYNAVFFGILRDREPVEPAIEELGLPVYMKELAGTTYYSPYISDITSSESFKNDFSKLSKKNLVFYYLKHPETFAAKLKISARHSGFVRPPYLSNRDISYTRLVFDESFSFWSRIRKRLPFDTIWFNAAVCLMFLVLAAGLFLKGCGCEQKRDEARMKAALALSLLFSALFNFCIPVISNGEADLAKHMFAFVSSVDLMIVIGIYLAVNMLSASITVKAVVCLSIAAFFLNLGLLETIETMVSERPYYIQMGEYNGKKLLWQVIKDGGEGYLLICCSAVEARPFSLSGNPNRLGSNIWKDSDLRAWLNTEFLKAFKPGEKELILDYENKYLLSAGNINLKRGGDREFFWTHIPELADRGYDSAFYDICVDKVFLPDIRDICNAHRAGADIRRECPYWLETPYFYDASMVRAVFHDGYIYMKDAVEKMGVVPAIRIKYYDGDVH